MMTMSGQHETLCQCTGALQLMTPPPGQEPRDGVPMARRRRRGRQEPVPHGPPRKRGRPRGSNPRTSVDPGDVVHLGMEADDDAQGDWTAGGAETEGRGTLRQWKFYSKQEAFMEDLEDDAVRRGYDFYVSRRESRRLEVVCARRLCHWRCRLYQSVKHDVHEITIYNDKHDCRAFPPEEGEKEPRGRQNSIRWLKRHLHQDVLAKPMLTVAEAKHLIRRDWHVEAEYHPVFRALYRLRREIWGDQVLNYSKMYPLCDLLKEKDPTGIAVTETYEESRTWKRTFVAPRACLDAWQHMRPFVGMDATFGKGEHPFALLIAVGVDANDKILPIAWAVCRGECAAF